MDHYTRDAELVRDETGVLAGRAAKCNQNTPRHIMAALQRNLPDRFRHISYGNIDETLRDLFWHNRLAGCRLNLSRALCKLFCGDLLIDRRNAAVAKHRGVKARL